MRSDPYPQIPSSQDGRKCRQNLRPALFWQCKAYCTCRQVFQKVRLQDKDEASVNDAVKIELARHQNLRNCDSGTPFSSIHLL